MALTWNEIRKRSIEFSKEWENESREEAYAQLDCGNTDLDRDKDGIPCESICL
jgi:hypothetical protein